MREPGNSVISDIMGMTGRAMLEAIIGGESDPVKLAALAHPRIKSPPEKLREGGAWQDHAAPRVSLSD